MHRLASGVLASSAYRGDNRPPSVEAELVIVDMFEAWPHALGFVVLLGLIVGSFLNVVIHRLPIMMELRGARNAPSSFPGAAPAPAPPRQRTL